MTRTVKTDRERAEEALAVAKRRQERSRVRLKAASDEYAAAEKSHAEAMRLLAHATAHPALAEIPGQTAIEKPDAGPTCSCGAYTLGADLRTTIHGTVHRLEEPCYFENPVSTSGQPQA